mmetsp:Transcript_32843/g.60398  ORF Transcript_32843/g.60398 Transcript_32843/m.60398 type:complete len:220 (-) Transcript_32843:7-666(-)
MKALPKSSQGIPALLAEFLLAFCCSPRFTEGEPERERFVKLLASLRTSSAGGGASTHSAASSCPAFMRSQSSAYQKSLKYNTAKNAKSAAAMKSRVLGINKVEIPSPRKAAKTVCAERARMLAKKASLQPFLIANSTVTNHVLSKISATPTAQNDFKKAPISLSECPPAWEVVAVANDSCDMIVRAATTTSDGIALKRGKPSCAMGDEDSSITGFASES